MGRKNTITKDYMSVPEHFADCFNHYLYGGKPVIQPEQLRACESTEFTVIPKDNTVETAEKYRDVLKQCIIMKDDRATYLLLGIENQSDIHYALPVKTMNYDALNYAKQVADIARGHRQKNDIKDGGEYLSGFTRKDKLKPIIGLTVYFGAKKWDGPRSLKEMFEELDEGILEYVEDYKVHILVPSEIQDFEKFSTDFGKVMKYIAVSEDKDALAKLQDDVAFQSVDADAVRLLNVCTNSNIKVAEGESKVDMCGGLKALLEEKESEGREEGRGLLLRALVEKKVQKGYSVEAIAEMLEEEEQVIRAIIEEL